MSPSKLTKYCTCHAKWPSNIWQKLAENSWNVISNARPIRDRSEHDPRMIQDRSRQSATRHATEVTFRAPDEHFVRKIQHFELWLFFQISPSTAPATKSDTWPSPSTAPAMQCLILVTYETSFPMHGATNVTLQIHQILRLPRKMTTQHLAEIGGKQLKRHFQCAADPRPFRAWSENDPRMIQDRSRQSATRHATEVTFRAQDEHFVLKNTTFCTPAIFPNFTEYCTCHEKWHLTFTKYCACHEKCHLTLLDSTITQRFYYLTLLLLSDLTLLLLSDSITWLYYY